MQNTHHIKLSHEFQESVLCGDKNFEVRDNDRGYQKGDLIRFTVVDKCGLTMPSPLNKKQYVITYVLSGWGIKEGYVVFGFQPVEGEANA